MAEGLVVWAMPTVDFTRAGSIRGPCRLRKAPCVKLPSTLWALETALSTPLAMPDGGRAGWKWKCGPHASSTWTGTPRACATSAMAARSDATPQ